MLFSKRDLEGYVRIDHRDGPGLSVDHRFAAGLPLNMPVGQGMLLEAPTLTCSHCQTVVIINPDRARERAYCSYCDHYICDGCGAAMRAPGYVHRSFKQIADEFRARAARGA